MQPQEAARAALEYLRTFIPQAQSVLVEEVEKDLEEAAWIITLSYWTVVQPHGFGGMEKEYKTFRVDSNTGEVISMKMRLVK
jgi:hypothetical protein